MFFLNKIESYFSGEVLEIFDKPIEGALHVEEFILLIGLVEEVPFDVDCFFWAIFKFDLMNQFMQVFFHA